MCEQDMKKLNIDSVEYELDQATDAARELVKSVVFVDEQLLQLNNELQVAETAKIGYMRALKRELAKIDDYE